MDQLVTLNEVVLALVYVGVALALFAVGLFTFDRLSPRFDLRRQLVEHDNLAVGIATAGYLVGLMIALAGVLVGESLGLFWDVVDLVVFGLAAIALLGAATLVNDRLILHAFKNEDELIRDQNAGMGAISAGTHIAAGLIVYGAVSGFGDGLANSLLSLVVFFALGQAVLIAVGLIYEAVMPFDLHREIEKDNVAVGVAFAGVLVAVGNLARIATEGDFISWTVNLANFGILMGFGLLLLPLLRLLVDRVVLPGRKISAELAGQEVPNAGAGFLAASTYLVVSILLGFSI